MVETGIERLLQDGVQKFRDLRVGAIVHPASILPGWRHTADALFACRDIDLRSLFGPQHGARGEKQDNMIESEFYRDPDTGLPVHSLYGETRIPTEEMLSDLDVVLFDLQDVGTRVYTFINTMAYAMQACARYRKKLVVLDRPNPVNGAATEGNVLQPPWRSFVGLYSVPMRHGMTAGELALMFNHEEGVQCDLEIIRMHGWSRSDWFDETGLSWVQPSPNLPTLDSATVYPGMVLVEGTLLSEGRGTTRPFEYVGAPYIKARSYAECLNSFELPGVHFRPAYFQPTFQKWAGELCGGVQIHVTDRQVFESYVTGIATIWAARTLYPEQFKWRNPPYEYENEKLPIDILAGGPNLREMIETGMPIDRIRSSWEQELSDFARRRRSYLLYE
jgi:uncharacterized protein YbbC (DUF1343 family)